MPEPTSPSCANALANAAKGADDVPAPHEANERVPADTSGQSGAPGNGKGLDVDAIMSRVRHEVAKRGATTEGWFDPMGETITGAHWRPVAPRLPPRDQYALSDFLRFNDEDLVDVAYRTLLRRPANDDGSRSYVDALRHGAVSKVEVLGSIRFSDEGRRQSVHVDGLLRPYTLHRWRRIPVVGWFVGMGMALVRLPRLALRLQGMEAAAAHETQALGRWVNHVDAAVAKRMLRTEDDLRALRDEFSELNRAFEAATARVKANEAKLHESNTRRQAELKESNDRYEAMLHDSAVRHDAALKSLNERVLKDQRSLRGMLDRLTVFLDANMRQHGEGAATGPHEQTLAREQQYMSFENAFRGDRGEIKERVAYYLEPLAKAGIEPAGENVILDLGSGRGEWLEVLAERGYCGRGVDLNREMVKESQARGHEVVEADVLSFLKAQEGDSFAAISSMHLIEHLPHAALIQLLDEAVRVLRPGGVLILETPNPENVRVGSCMFYMDPTHLNPIPPLLLQWLVQTRGFEQATIERLSDHRGKPDLVPVSEDVPGAAQINQMVEWFTVPPDYAVIARKPLP